LDPLVGLPASKFLLLLLPSCAYFSAFSRHIAAQAYGLFRTTFLIHLRPRKSSPFIEQTRSAKLDWFPLLVPEVLLSSGRFKLDYLEPVRQCLLVHTRDFTSRCCWLHCCSSSLPAG